MGDRRRKVRTQNSWLPLLNSSKPFSWQFLVFYSIVFFGLDAISAIASAPTSVYDYPFTTLAWVAGIWIFAFAAKSLLVGKNLLANYLVWLLISCSALALANFLIFLVTREPLVNYDAFDFASGALISWVNLLGYALVFTAASNYRAGMTALKIELLNLESFRNALMHQVATVKSKLLSEVNREILPTIQGIRESIQSANKARAMNQAREALEQIVVPLSRQFSQSSIDHLSAPLPQAPDLSIWARIRTFAKTRVNFSNGFAPLPVAIAYLISIGPAQAYFYGNEGWISAGVNSAVFFITQAIISRWLKNLRLSPVAAVLVGIASSTVISCVVFLTLGLFVASHSPEIDLLLWFGTWLVLTVAFTALILNEASKAVIADLEETQKNYSNSLSKRDAEIANLRFAISQFVHSDLQGQLRSVLIRLKQSEGQVVMPESLEKQLAEVLDNLASIENSASFHFNKELDRLIEFWSGICEISCHIETSAEPDLESDDALAESAFSVINEVVANAIKHSEAEKIDVRVSTNGVYLSIQISNPLPGHKVEVVSSGGVGSSIFDKYCSSWSANTIDGQFLFQARIVIR
jgi:hypothetical protein